MDWNKRTLVTDLLWIWIYPDRVVHSCSQAFEVKKKQNKKHFGWDLAFVAIQNCRCEPCWAGLFPSKDARPRKTGYPKPLAGRAVLWPTVTVRLAVTFQTKGLSEVIIINMCLKYYCFRSNDFAKESVMQSNNASHRQYLSIMNTAEKVL